MLDSNTQFEPDAEEFNEPAPAFKVEETFRPTRNIEGSNYNESALASDQSWQEQYKQHHWQQHHNEQQQSSSKSQRLPLNLHYKPRYQHNDLEHQHYKQHKRRNKNRQQHHKHPTHQQQNTEPHNKRQRRYISSGSQFYGIPQELHVETAIFVDSDLFNHMTKNFPKHTERHLIRFVLAMINGVQLLYHHPTLGHRVNFVLKRLEILYTNPTNLGRSNDIDIYLSNFCMWQKNLNPTPDSDALHYDHAVILTGLDLFVVGKNGNKIHQVVGLAPVAGMCTPTSSCTINEGKHFESVFVVAHEIGHNLGMRHDTNDNNCDHTLYIMSPTLGSGKTTWSKCSRNYLDTFLNTNQAKCLFDRGQFANNLDHTAEGLLPGERFDANQQCMLKYGRESVRARTQNISDICRDLHCQRDRYTWTSHPALEGTECGKSMWCRTGVCEMRPTNLEPYSSAKLLSNTEKRIHEKASFMESSKMGHLLQYNKVPTWSEWSEPSQCDSGCLYGPSKRLLEGSTGLKVYSRSCLYHRRGCSGSNRKFESCIARLCYSIAIKTIADFATEVCEKTRKFDTDLTGDGEQIVGNRDESCKVFCKTKSNSTKSRNWTFPDGTTCRSKEYNQDDISYCVAGRCEKFSCDNSTNNYYKTDATFCQQRQPQAPKSNADIESRRTSNYNNIPAYGGYDARDSSYKSHSNRNVGGIHGPTTVRNKYENEVALRNYHGQQQTQQHEQSYKRKSEPYRAWDKYNYYLNDQMPAAPSTPVSASLVAHAPTSAPDWTVKSGCHSSCIAKSKGIQVVVSRRTGENNIQLCSHTIKPCERLLTPAEYAENTCARYKLKVRGLSGHGTQIAASVDEPDRSCRVGCQDEFIKYRFYLVNGKYGHFPLGTKCSHTEERYCVNGKCLEFGADNIPLQQSHISLALYRKRRSVAERSERKREQRRKRSYLYYQPVNITETITQEFINKIVNSIIDYEQKNKIDELKVDDNIEFTNPIYIFNDEMN